MTDRRAFLTAALVAPVAIAAPALAAPVFDPGEWLRGFVALGGAINVQKDGAHFWYPPDEEIISYMQDIGRMPEKWALVRARAESVLA
ncbi:hypothetical protein [Sphingobium yanoikuyae]|jgi:hypothetical protein